MLLKLLAIQIAWIGCVPIYCASKWQVLLNQPIPKPWAWVSFVASVILSNALMFEVYHPLTSIIFIVVVVSLTWLVLALWLPYRPNVKLVFLSLAMVMVLAGMLGGGHVV